MSLSTPLGIDTNVLGFTSLIVLVTGIAFGLAPAGLVSRIDLNEALQQSGGACRARSGAARGRLRGAMIVTQVGLAFVLLVGTSLLVQTLYRLRTQYSGLEPDGVL